jgi:hypothetical protein
VFETKLKREIRGAAGVQVFGEGELHRIPAEGETPPKVRMTPVRSKADIPVSG